MKTLTGHRPLEELDHSASPTPGVGAAHIKDGVCRGVTTTSPVSRGWFLLATTAVTLLV